MLSAFAISQILVGCALVTDTISWQCKRRQIVLTWLVCSTLLIGMHFVLLGEAVAAAVLFLSGVRFATAIFYTARWLWLPFALIGFVPLIWLHGPTDIAASILNVGFCWAAFQPTDRLLRLWVTPSIIAWIAYNAWIGSPAGMVLESLFLISNLVGYWRHYGQAELAAWRAGF